MSTTFYDGRLADDKSVEARVAPIVRLRPEGGAPIVVADISTLPADAPSYESSRYNVLSALVTVISCAELIQDGGRNIAVIAPFRAQARLLHKIIVDCQWTEAVRVATVHRFQGNEADAVILDLTTSPPHSPLGPLLAGDIYALAGRLLNVALSRASDDSDPPP